MFYWNPFTIRTACRSVYFCTVYLLFYELIWEIEINEVVNVGGSGREILVDSFATLDLDQGLDFELDCSRLYY